MIDISQELLEETDQLDVYGAFGSDVCTVVFLDSEGRELRVIENTKESKAEAIAARWRSVHSEKEAN